MTIISNGGVSNLRVGCDSVPPEDGHKLTETVVENKALLVNKWLRRWNNT
jgi:hypothetical protein